MFRFQVKNKAKTVKVVLDLRPRRRLLLLSFFPFIKNVRVIYKNNDVLIPAKLTFSVKNWKHLNRRCKVESTMR